MFIAAIFIYWYQTTEPRREAARAQERTRQALATEAKELRHPVITLGSASYAVSGPDGTSYKRRIEVTARKPSYGSWELLSLGIEGPGGDVEGYLDGRDAGPTFSFVLDQLLEKGAKYTAKISLRYAPRRGKPVVINRELPLGSWEAATQYYGPMVRTISARQEFSQDELELQKESLGIGADLVFSGNGRFAFLGAIGNSRSFRPEPDGRILVLERTPRTGWELNGVLAPISRQEDTSAPTRFFWFGGDMSASRDGGIVATGACETESLCNEIHFFERSASGDWVPRQVLTVNPEAVEGMFPYDCELAPSGDMVCVLVESGIRIYRRQEGGKWRLSQTLPKPDLGKGHHLNGSVAFTGDGRRLFIGAPTSSRGSYREGAVLVYGAGEDGRFAEEPEYVSPSEPGGGVGRTIAVSGNGQVLAVSGMDQEGGNLIHVYDVVDGKLRHSQVLEKPSQFLNETKDLNFANRFSISNDGTRILSGPTARIVHNGVFRDEWMVQTMLYRRGSPAGEFRAEHLRRLGARYFVIREVPPYLSLGMSPDGSELIFATSGVDRREQGSTHRVFTGCRLAVYPLPRLE